MSAASSRAERGLLTNSMALLAMSHSTALLGYVFWMLCARRVSADAIGITNTVISAMSLVTVLTVAGLVPLLTRALPGSSPAERSGLCSTALTFTGLVSGIGGVVGAFLLPASAQTAVGMGWLLVLLGLGAVGTALLNVINAALLGVRRAELSLLGSAVASMSRLVIVFLLLILGLLVAKVDPESTRTILVVWVGSLFISVGLSLRLLFRATPGFRFRPGRVWLDRLRRGVAWEHLAALSARLPDFAVPILAAALLPAAHVGYLAMAWLVSTAFFAVSAAVANALLADCADRPEKLRAQTRRAVRLIAILLVAPVAAACLLSHWVLGLFGADYARYGSTLLILLLLCSLPEALVNVAVSVLRLQNRLVATAAVTMGGTILMLGGVWLLIPRLGIVGAGWAALVSQIAVLVVLLVAAVCRSLASQRSVSANARPTSPADVSPSTTSRSQEKWIRR